MINQWGKCSSVFWRPSQTCNFTLSMRTTVRCELAICLPTDCQVVSRLSATISMSIFLFRNKSSSHSLVYLAEDFLKEIWSRRDIINIWNDMPLQFSPFSLGTTGFNGTRPCASGSFSRFYLENVQKLHNTMPALPFTVLRSILGMYDINQ